MISKRVDFAGFGGSDVAYPDGVLFSPDNFTIPWRADTGFQDKFSGAQENVRRHDPRAGIYTSRIWQPSVQCPSL